MSEDKTKEKDVLEEAGWDQSRPEIYVDVRYTSPTSLSIEGADFDIVENHKDALDIDLVKERYSDIFEKFDYIVGDIGYDKLRLRGLYEDDTRGVPLDMRISTLEDYLIEYCNFDSPYFVLKRLSEKTVFPDYDPKDRLRNQGSGKHKQKGRKKKRPKKQQRKRSHRKFETKKKKEVERVGRDKKGPVQEKVSRDDDGKKRFKIKKKE